jgi:nucleolar protein 4
MPKSIDNTVFVRLVPAPTHKVKRHELEDIFSQMGPVKKSSWINAKQPQRQQGEQKNGDADGLNDSYNNSSSKGYGFVKYLSQQDAEAAANELNNSKIQMEGKEFTLKVELASLTAPKANAFAGGAAAAVDRSKSSSYKDIPNVSTNESTPDGQDESALLKKKSRIILRNLSFYAKEQDIRKIMERRFGKVIDVHLPRVKDNLHVGFAFVTFHDPKDAQSAVSAKNVDISKRTVSMDWSLPKNVHQQQKQQKQQPTNQSKENDQSAMDEDSDDADDDDEKGTETSSSEDDSENDDCDSPSSHSGDGDDDDDDDDNDSNQSDDDGEEVFGEDDDGSDEEEEHDDDVKKKCTLFLRNLPFDATRNDVFQAFHRFGYITGVYLVKDKDTGMPKGTAFVTFSKPQSAQRAIEYASTEGGDEFVTQREGTKKSHVDQHGESGGSLMIKDRRVFVNLAVDKETAATFDSKDDKIPSADRRNLYLQAESRVESSSTEPGANNADTWDDLPASDQKKRQTALKDKTTKLQSPIFFINPNRLSFRNLAKHIDEAALQKLIEDAVKRGLEKGLVSAKDQIAHMRALGEMSTRDILAKIQEMERNNEEIIPSWTNGDVDTHRQFKHNIPSVYIARDIGPSGKKKDAPSRGFAFAEFTHHTHALACLRELNNNPIYSRDYVAGGKAADAIKKRGRKNKKMSSSGNEANGGGNDFVGDDGRVHVPRLIVDFTVENKMKAKKQAERRVQQELNRTKQYLENKERKIVSLQEGGEEKPKKRGRGAIQREKKRLRRESGEEEKERQAKLEAKALAEARKELRKERQAQRQKQKVEESKKKAVKPPKKKKPVDEEDEKFDDIVRSYTSKLETTRKQTDSHNPRVAVTEKRWFE